MPHQGTFCWADLATQAPAAAKTFYAELLGWTFEDLETGQEVPYSLCQRDGKRVAGLYEMAPEQGAFPYWASYVRVADLAATTERAVALGGRILMPRAEMLRLGAMAFIQDPTRAVLGLWQPGTLAGVEALGTLGAPAWIELQTRDLTKAAVFYAGLFGWETRDDERASDTRRALFVRDGQTIGGMMLLDASWGSMPASWSTCFGVTDCDAAVATTERRGGSVVMDPVMVDAVGRIAVLGDPQGAIFAVVEPAIPPAL